MSAQKRGFTLVRSAKANTLGFTLVELLVVISIITILSIVGITVFTGVQKSTRDSRRRADLHVISQALEQYKSSNGEYPFPRNPPQLEGNPWYCDSRGNWADNEQIKNALNPYFSNGIPKDPAISANYKIDMVSQGGYFLYTTFEIDPGPPYPTLEGDGCTGARPVHLLIKNQQ